MTTIRPNRGEIYTVEQIYSDLDFRDFAFLTMQITNPLNERVEVVVQNGESGEKGILKAFATKSFRYICETDESIPVFDFMGTEQQFLECVDTAVHLNPFQRDDEKIGMLVWSKGTTYEQHYKLSEDGSEIFDSCASYPVPCKIHRALEALKKSK